MVHKWVSTSLVKLTKLTSSCLFLKLNSLIGWLFNSFPLSITFWFPSKSSSHPFGTLPHVGTQIPKCVILKWKTLFRRFGEENWIGHKTKVKWHTIMLMVCPDDLGFIDSKRRGGLMKFYLWNSLSKDYHQEKNLEKIFCIER